MNNLVAVLKTILTRPVAFHRVFAEVAGGAAQGLFLSQAFYWSQRTSNPEGWFYKTLEQWNEETALTRREQESARKSLKRAGILEEKKEGLPCKLYYRLNIDKLFEKISRLSSKKEAETLDKSKFVQNDKQDCTNSQTALSFCTNNLYTETTTEIYTETTSPQTPQGAGAGEEALPVDVSAELVCEQPQPSQSQTQSFCQQDQTEAPQNQPNQELGQIAPARENDSQIVKQEENTFESLEGKIDLRNGQPYKPWMVLLGQNKRLDISPDFLKFVAKENLHKPYFKEMKASQLPRETKNWIKRHEEEAIALWEEFNNPQEMPMGDKTVQQIQNECKNKESSDRLKAVGFDWNEFMKSRFNFDPSQYGYNF